jgi:hypothetical protein
MNKIHYSHFTYNDAQSASLLIYAHNIMLATHT